MHVLSEFPQFGMPSSLMNFINDMSYNVSKFRSSTLKDITHINEFHTRVKQCIRNSQIGRQFCAPRPLMGATVFHNEVNGFATLCVPILQPNLNICTNRRKVILHYRIHGRNFFHTLLTGYNVSPPKPLHYILLKLLLTNGIT
jgi:hypothetical protein